MGKGRGCSLLFYAYSASSTAHVCPLGMSLFARPVCRLTHEKGRKGEEGQLVKSAPPFLFTRQSSPLVT